MNAFIGNVSHCVLRHLNPVVKLKKLSGKRSPRVRRDVLRQPRLRPQQADHRTIWHRDGHPFYPIETVKNRPQ